MLQIANISDKFAQFTDHWSPKLAARVNDTAIKLVKLRGEFVWHHHEHEDELFWVMKGRLRIRLRDGELALGPGDFVVIPRGVEHLPVADEEVHVVLIEPDTTLNTGNVRSERTVEKLDAV